MQTFGAPCFPLQDMGLARTVPIPILQQLDRWFTISIDFRVHMFLYTKYLSVQYFQKKTLFFMDFFFASSVCKDVQVDRIMLGLLAKGSGR